MNILFVKDMLRDSRTAERDNEAPLQSIIKHVIYFFNFQLFIVPRPSECRPVKVTLHILYVQCQIVQVYYSKIIINGLLQCISLNLISGTCIHAYHNVKFYFL